MEKGRTVEQIRGDLDAGKLTLPGGELTVAYARSGGPGGQRVNKVETKVQLRWSFSDSAVLDDAAKRFREHYACFERNRTDPADTRLVKVDGRMTDKTARQYFGEFYPTSGFGKWNPGFSPKDPPAGSYVA